MPPPNLKKTLYIGLMSGTSMDGIDSALIRCENNKISQVHSLEHTISDDIRDRIAAISQPGDDEIERMGRLDRELGQLFAEAVNALLLDSGIRAEDIAAIGSHGQTIRHRPPSALTGHDTAFTLQIGDPNTIAELTGITTVADFRRRDVAANGEGAPLAPAFHQAAFAATDRCRAVINIGGIANVTVLQGDTLVAGFDTGPGNTLLDHWIARIKGRRYDQGGAWAGEGKVHQPLLESLLSHPFLGKQGPRSTGKEAFNLDWVDSCLEQLSAIDARDVQATLSEFTADTIAQAVQSQGVDVQEVYICGGGAHNTDLMRRMYRRLEPATLDTTNILGIHPDWVEAAAFAWLAQQAVCGLAGNAPVVTGAQEFRILGGIYPGN
ncbi:MAG: anhydro-N-acetylmuramic acid kinase [Halioglobus sp.]